MQPEISEDFLRHFVQHLLFAEPAEQTEQEEESTKQQLNEQQAEMYYRSLVHTVFQVLAHPARLQPPACKDSLQPVLPGPLVITTYIAFVCQPYLTISAHSILSPQFDPGRLLAVSNCSLCG